jgi:hypothetical protein
LLPFTASRVGKLAAILTLGLAFLFQSARAQGTNLVGEWLAGKTNFADVSGYSLPGTHDGFLVGSSDYVFTNDVPPGASGESLYFTAGDTGLAITNSSTLDSNYTNTFDGPLTNAFSVACWAKGFPGQWSPWVSKFGENNTSGANEGNGGWQLRDDGSTANGDEYACFSVRNGGVGAVTLGAAVYGNSDDMATRSFPSDDGNWHLYAGVFSAVTGQRSLYIDGVLAANESNNVPWLPAAAEHLCIGAKDSPPGNSFGNFSTFEIYDVRVYNYAISPSQILKLLGSIPPTLIGQPQSEYVFVGTTAQMSVGAAGGTPPVSYQWTLDGQVLTNGASFSGVNSNKLTILNVGANDVGTYQLIVTNNYGTNVSSNATLNVETPSLVGEWLAGPTNLTDVSGFSSKGTHDAVVVGGGNYLFTNDVPFGKSGQSLWFFNGDTGLAITNSSTLDTSYVNTFDDPIQREFTVTCWSRGYPGGWSPWVSKFGENNTSGANEGNAGWQLRDDGSTGETNACFTVRDGSVGDVTLGAAIYGNSDDMATTTIHTGNDGKWHFYAGVFNAWTGERSLYVDGLLAAQETNNAPDFLASAEHLCIGAKDSPPGNSFGNYSTFEIYDVRVYNYAFTSSQIGQVLGNIGPEIFVQPPSTIGSYQGSNAQISVGAVGGTAPVAYQWQFDGVNLTNGANFSGVNSNILTILNAASNDIGTYRLIITNQYGTNVSSNVIFAAVMPVIYRLSWGPPVPITTPEATLLIPGKLVYAASFGGQAPSGSDYVVTLDNGMQFDFTYEVNAAVNGNGESSGAFSGSTGDTNFNGVLNLFNYDDGPKTITLNNLTPGLRYAVQLFGLDDRSPENIRQAYYADPADLLNRSATFLMGDNDYVVATFLTSTNSSQDIIEELPGNAAGGDVDSGNINAVVVRLAPPNISIVNNNNGTVTVTWDQNLKDTLTGAGPAHLLSAPSLSGPWTDQGVSGTLTVSTSGTQAQFFKAEIP